MNNTQLTKAIERNSDYSIEFSEKIKKLGISLSASLKLLVIHDDDMNYKSSQELKVYLNSEFQNVDNKHKQTSYWIRVFISSKGLFAALLLKYAFRKNIWGTVDLKDVPIPIQVIQKRIIDFLIMQNYTILSGDILEEIVPNKYNEIDDQPATVFNILFAEEV